MSGQKIFQLNIFQHNIFQVGSLGSNTGAGSHRIGRRPKRHRVRGVLERIKAEQVEEVLPIISEQPAALVAPTGSEGRTPQILAVEPKKGTVRLAPDWDEDEEDAIAMLLAA